MDRPRERGLPTRKISRGSRKLSSVDKLFLAIWMPSAIGAMRGTMLRGCGKFCSNRRPPVNARVVSTIEFDMTGKRLFVVGPVFLGLTCSQTAIDVRSRRPGSRSQWSDRPPLRARARGDLRLHPPLRSFVSDRSDRRQIENLRCVM
jgi:hypothetical protein